MPATRTLWMSANSPHPIVYDPRSASDITGFLQQTATTSLEQREAKERVHRLFRIDETGPPPSPHYSSSCTAARTTECGSQLPPSSGSPSPPVSDVLTS